MSGALDHDQIEEEVGVEPPLQAAQHPWQHRTNGLLRGYFPKGEPLRHIREKCMREQRIGSTEGNARRTAQKHYV